MTEAPLPEAPRPKILKPKELDTVELLMTYEDGKPVVAKVRRLNAREVGRIQGTLPGLSPDESGAAKATAERVIEGMERWAIASCVDPALTASDDPDGDAIPISWLGHGDLTRIVETGMRLSGVLGDSFRPVD